VKDRPGKKDKHNKGVGYMSKEEFEQLKWAIDYAPKITPWLRVAGYIKSADADIRVQISRSGHVNLPPTWLAAETITGLLKELSEYELEDTVNDDQLVEVCRQLIREVKTAHSRWPMEDHPHQVKFMRCLACELETLKYYPPKFVGDEIVVKCANPACLAVLDSKMFGFATLLIKQQRKAQ